jgi:hypothetical protein
MTSNEHILAIVDAAEGGEATLDIARDVVSRGGRATVLVLSDPVLTGHLRAFAASENLDVNVAGAIYNDRLIRGYTTRVGGPGTTVTIDEHDSGLRVLSGAAGAGATAVAIPQRLLGDRRWRTAVRRSPLPVVVTPPRAA